MKQLLLFAISILLLPFVLAASGNEYQNAEKALTKKLTGNPTEAIDSATSLVIFNDALSADEKAQGKGKAVGILFGAIMIAGVSTIAKLILSVVE